MFVATAETDSDGGFSVSFTVPWDASAGPFNLVQAIDELGRRATAVHQIPPATLEVIPAQGPPGSTVEIRGTGFRPTAPLTSLTFDQFDRIDQIDRSDLRTGVGLGPDALGSFVFKLLLPEMPPGEVELSASTFDIAASSILTVIAPAESPKPTLIPQPTPTPDLSTSGPPSGGGPPDFYPPYVNTTADSDDGVCEAESCSLREAIAVAGSGGAMIPAGTYTLTLGQLTIDGSTSLIGAGVDSTIIQAATEPGVATHRVLNIERGEVNINDLTIRYGHEASEDGGGIINSGTLTLTNVSVIDNTVGGLFAGGGINNNGRLTLINSTVGGNTANTDAGITNSGTLELFESTITGNSAVGRGGGVGNFASMVVEASVISGNSAGSDGGGIYYGASSSAAIIINSTISGNTASAGGGLAWESTAGAMDLHSSTINNNSGGGVSAPVGTIGVTNTIIANNSDGDCLKGVTSHGHNLDSDGTCGLIGPGDIAGADPLLGPLQDNGGPTFSHGLLAGSPAIDAGDIADCGIYDQRGVTRPRGAVCDIGAYER